MNASDIELLTRYAVGNAQDAFSELVRRHLGLVYSAALRQVRSPELAREVAQTVFLDLARNAQKLPANTILSAWLYQVARRAAIDVVRRESRRQRREQDAHQLSLMNASSAEWTEIEPLLDEAMQSLDDDDRAAVIMRYFENKSLREVGESLGTTENAAQKRLARAVDRLSEFFSARGMGVSATVLAATLSTHAVQAVPLGLSAAIVAFTAQTATTGAFATTAITTMSAIKTTAIAATFMLALGTAWHQSRQAFALRTELKTLKTNSAFPLGTDNSNAERAEAMRQLAALRAENERLNQNLSELMRLRDEVTRLKRDAQTSAAIRAAEDSVEAAAKNWATRVTLLRTRLEQAPEAQTPEMQLLTPEDWLAAVKQPDLETDQDFRKAFATLRNTAQQRLAALLQPALAMFLKANSGNFPTDVSDLRTYLERPVDSSVLGRYAVMPASVHPNVVMGGDWIITQIAPVDRELDQRIVIGPRGYGSSNYPRLNEPSVGEIKMLDPAIKAFQAANNGREPLDPTHIEPYLTTPEQKAIYKKLLEFHTARKK